MLELSCKSIVNKMVENKIIDAEKFEIYVYNLQIITLSLLIHLLLLFFAAISGHLIDLLLFMIAFDGIRQFSGGYHCNTAIGCVVLSVIMCISMILLEELMLNQILIYQSFVMLSAIFIVAIGAVNHPYMGWSCSELIKAKRGSRISTTCFICLMLFMNLINVENSYIYYVGMGIIICAISLISEMIITKKGGKSYEEL